MNGRDRELGMGRAITRRDLLSGMGVALSGSLLLPWASTEALALAPGQLPAGQLSAEQLPAAPYPPALTGLRGSHPGSFEVAHAVRDGKRWPDAEDSGETYDLVVVGGGLSGLSAAWFYRQKAGPEARILILDNHDDFGGHARRNELHHRVSPPQSPEGDGDRMLLGFGGTFNVEDYGQYGRAARRLLRSLEIDVTRGGELIDRDLYSSLSMRESFFFDRETFGTDRLVVERSGESRADFLARTPLSEAARRSLTRLFDRQVDYLPDLSLREKRDFLRGVSYRQFLQGTAGVHPDAMPFLETSDDVWAVGIDALSAWAARWGGYPGLGGLGLPEGEGGGHSLVFPDGNASIARLLVQSLIPDVAPPADMERIVTARLDYSQLDRQDARVRLRLESTAIRVVHRGGADRGDPSTATEVEVTYVQSGGADRGVARKVRAGHCILACYNSVIPYLCPELPETQRRALSLSLKAPLVYTNVLLRSWTVLHEMGVEWVRSPGCYHNSFGLTPATRIGDYRPSTRPEDPAVLFLIRVPRMPGLTGTGLTAQEQWRAGRVDLLATTFETFERQTRSQLGRILKAGGFDPARDIEAITVNRWPHGYGYGQDLETGEVAWMGDEVPPGRRSWELGRKPFGRIAIANSDAAGNAMTEAAIGEAHRAVRELEPRRSRRRGRASGRRRVR